MSLTIPIASIWVLMKWHMNFAVLILFSFVTWTEAIKQSAAISSMAPSSYLSFLVYLVLSTTNRWMAFIPATLVWCQMWLRLWGWWDDKQPTVSPVGDNVCTNLPFYIQRSCPLERATCTNGILGTHYLLPLKVQQGCDTINMQVFLQSYLFFLWLIKQF